MIFKFFLSLTIVIAIFLRLWQLNTLPPALNWDEVSIGYNAYSILKTGMDEWGQRLPLSFRAYGDYKLPMYVYLDVPFIAIFGPSELAVRIPSAILGVLFVFLISLIMKNLADVHVRSWAAFLAAISPWTIIISRIALEAQLALFLTTLAFYLFIRGLKSKLFLILSGLSFGLTIFSYNSSRVVTPLLVIGLGFFFWDQIKHNKKEVLLSLSLFLIFFVVALPKALLQDSSARYRWTAILDEGAISRINELRGSSALPPTLAVATYNKVTYVIPEIFKNYISHFNPDFLFISGGSNYQFSTPGNGLFYPILVPFLIYGLWIIFLEKKKWQFFIIFWLLVSIIPAAITRDSPHSLRSLMMIVPIIIITSLGLGKFIELFGKVRFIVKLVLICILLGNLYMFWINYSGNYVKNYSWSWQYGYKEVVEFIKNNGGHYEKIYITKKYGEPHEFLLFYSKYDPAKYINDPNLVRYFRSDWYWVDSFNKYDFVNDWEIKDSAKCKVQSAKCLLITSPGNYPDNGKLLKTINFLDGKPAFDIVEI